MPVKGPEGDPENELNLAEFDDIPIPLNSKLDKKESIIISKEMVGLDDSHSTHLKLKLLFLTFSETNYLSLDGKNSQKFLLRLVYSIIKIERALLLFKFLTNFFMGLML